MVCRKDVLQMLRVHSGSEVSGQRSNGDHSIYSQGVDIGISFQRVQINLPYVPGYVFLALLVDDYWGDKVLLTGDSGCSPRGI